MEDYIDLIEDRGKYPTTLYNKNKSKHIIVKDFKEVVENAPEFMHYNFDWELLDKKAKEIKDQIDRIDAEIETLEVSAEIKDVQKPKSKSKIRSRKR